MTSYLRWLAAPPFLWTKMTENQFSTFLLYRFLGSASTRKADKHLQSHYMYHQQIDLLIKYIIDEVSQAFHY